MVDVGAKDISKRTATAQSIVVLQVEVLKQLTQGDFQIKKGSVFQIAIIADHGGKENRRPYSALS